MHLERSSVFLFMLAAFFNNSCVVSHELKIRPVLFLHDIRKAHKLWWELLLNIMIY